MPTPLSSEHAVKLSVQQMLLAYDAMTDKLYEWRTELRLRAKNGGELRGLQRNYNTLMEARDALRDVLRQHGYQRN
jgi:hypothetical protein